MKAVSLFSGGGGMDFALTRLGVDVLFSNDICPEACVTLKNYFPHSDVHVGDIRNIEKFPTADLVVGGYPCQSFSLGGLRKPSNDPRSYLYREFARCLSVVQPKYFIAENVSGMAGVENGKWFDEQKKLFASIGKGYVVSHRLVRAEQYGVPQRRKRIFLVGVRRDQNAEYVFPERTHGDRDEVAGYPRLLPYASHGEAIRHLPLNPKGEYYERPHDPLGHMSWYYMSRNRKVRWADPSFCIVANFRHITLHPACSTMKMAWSRLEDGFKQGWEFTGEYEHLDFDPTLPVLEIPRRLSWREAAAIQTFPLGYEPAGKLEKKFEQVGNAVPPLLFETIARGVVDGSALRAVSVTSNFDLLKQSDLFSGEAAE